MRRMAPCLHNPLTPSLGCQQSNPPAAQSNGGMKGLTTVSPLRCAVSSYASGGVTERRIGGRGGHGVHSGAPVGSWLCVAAAWGAVGPHGLGGGVTHSR